MKTGIGEEERVLYILCTVSSPYRFSPEIQCHAIRKAKQMRG